GGLDYAGSGSIHDLGGGVTLAETVTNFAPGSLKATGVKTDVAIDGEGFFVVQKGAQRLLTRAGNFTREHLGQLVTPGGYAATSDGGAPITIDLAQPFEITDRGVVVQPGGAGVPLAVVRPRSLADLTRVGENLFAPATPPVPIPAT